VGRLEGVLAELRAGYLESGDQAASHASLAELAGAQAQFDEAQRHYRLAMTRLSDFIPAYTGLAELYRHQGKHAEAEKLLREALVISEKLAGEEDRRRSQQAELYYRLGLVVVFDRSRLREASDLLARAVRLSPGFGRARFAWATALLEMGNWEEAEAQYLVTYQQSPQSVEFRDGLASIYQRQVDKLARQQRWREALEYAEKLARLLPGDRRSAEQLEAIRRKAR
jgi:tetratricopeptide (TPR) repeat protein